MGKRKRRDSAFGVVGTGIVGTMIVSAIPTDSSNTGATNLKSQFSRGVGRVGEKIPAMGRIVGTSLVFKSLEKLNLKQSRRKR